jgi:pre-mRNA-processing factor SLU7
MSRDEFRKAKELEELRKTGAAPPELDEDGKMINPHIPLYVSKRPW